MGNDTEQEFEKIWASLGSSAFCFKLTDTREMHRFKAQTKKQPADYIVFHDGRAFFAEVKGSNNKTSFPFSNIAPHQIGYALRTEEAGGEYYFFVHNQNTKEWFRLPAELVVNTKRTGRKSLKWQELEQLRWSMMTNSVERSNS